MKVGITFQDLQVHYNISYYERIDAGINGIKEEIEKQKKLANPSLLDMVLRYGSNPQTHVICPEINPNKIFFIEISKSTLRPTSVKESKKC